MGTAPRAAQLRVHPRPGETGTPPEARLSARVERSISDGIGGDYPLTANAIPGDREHLQVHLRLTDGSPLTIDIHPMSTVPLSGWLPVVLVLQLAVLAACCWLAVRLATRPLKQLAQAADALGPDLKGERLNEGGPSEVARAARAFNAMQDRIAQYMAERMQILASISHDLQTPITRMRLRADMMEDDAQGAKLRQDLLEMEHLVKEGVAYARTLHGNEEAARRIDLDALLDSIVCDYTDAGQDVALHSRAPLALVTRPKALRRIVGNLVDNALKFAGAAEIDVHAAPDGGAVIAVLDRGRHSGRSARRGVRAVPARGDVAQPRDGRHGAGLAIARQLALAMGGTLTLTNRADGGGPRRG